MSRKGKRGILNQVIDEPIEETKEVVVESEPIIVDPELLKVEQPEEVVEEPVTPEEVVAEEEFINEVPEELNVEEQKKDVSEFWTKVEEVLEEPKEFHFDFQEEYFLGSNGKDAVIDTLPVEEPKVRTIDSLTKSELREFQRTGKMPK